MEGRALRVEVAREPLDDAAVIEVRDQLGISADRDGPSG